MSSNLGRGGLARPPAGTNWDPGPIYVGDANDPATILADSDVFYSAYFSASDDDEVAWINSVFDPLNRLYVTMPPFWLIGQRTSALVQMYDMIAPLDPARAGRYLERLRRIADAVLAIRDDKRHFNPLVAALFPPHGRPVDPFRGRVMAAWGAFTEDRDGKWNTDVVTSGLFTYAMAAFARRVADNPALQAPYGADAIRFTTATFETYAAFWPEMHLTDSDAQAWYTVPEAYAGLACNGSHACEGYRDTAGQPLAYNENLSMMKALAEASLAGTSELYLQSSESNWWTRYVAAYEAPLLIAKNFTFFDQNLRPEVLDSDGTPYFEWDTQKPTPPVIEDTAHGGFELGSLAVLLDDKIRLNALLAAAGRSERVGLSTPLFVRFANTFLRKIWHYDYHDASGLRNVIDNNVDGTSNPTETDNANKECAGWIPLAQFDPWIWTRCRDATFHPPGYLREDNHAALLRYRQFH